MELKIIDRIMIMKILPSESDFATLKVVKKIKDKLSFTEEEIKEYNIKTVTQRDGNSSSITWSKESQDKQTDIKLVRIEREIILTKLQELNSKKKATEIHLDLHEKINAFHEKIEKKG